MIIYPYLGLISWDFGFDVLIASTFYAIALILVYLGQQRPYVTYRWLFFSLGLMLSSCGTVHLIEIWTLHHPNPWLLHSFRFLTAFISGYALISLVYTMPPVLALPTVERLEAEIKRCRQVETELASQELILRSFYDSIPMIMGVVELQGEDVLHISDNAATAEFLGIKPTGYLASQLGCPPDILKLWLSKYRESVRTGQSVYFEYQHAAYYLSVIVTVINPQEGENPRFSYLIQDITAAKAIDKTYELQDIIVKNMAEGICLVKANNREIVYANPKFERIFGYDYGELTGKPVEILNYEDQMSNSQEVREEICREISAKGEHSYEVHNLKKDGTAFWCRATASCFEHPEYGLVYVVIQEDITQSKYIEEALRASQQRLQYLIKSSPSVTFICEPGRDYAATYISENILDILGYQSQEFLDNPSFWAERVHPEDKERVFMNLTKLLEQDFYSHEYRFLKADGSYCWLLGRLRLIRDEKGKPLEALGSLVDISDRKKSEELIANSLREKEILLKEIHHRVKNNLQVICSLLNLQSHAINNPDFREVLMGIKNRIIAMSILHEKLYRSEDFSMINLAEYAEDLAKNILSYHHIHPNKPNLKYALDPTIFLDIDTAVPCGLILNELISNACKYAFRPEQIGEIFIEASLNNNQKICLRVADNGKGLPKNFNLENSRTLGLQLVKSLINQLRGNLTISCEEGTRFTIVLERVKAKDKERYVS